MPLNPALVADTASDLLACACAAMTAAGRWTEACCDPTNANARAYVSDGLPVWDACCGECGQLTVRLTRLFEADSAPGGQVVGPANRCGGRLAIAEYEIQRLRCTTANPETVVGGVQLPTAAALNLQGVALLTDLWVLWTGVGCCVCEWSNSATDPRQGWMVDTIPDDPQGGCVGAHLTVQVVLGESTDCRPFTPPPIA